MGIGRHSGIRLDTGLLLHLERRQIDGKSQLLVIVYEMIVMIAEKLKTVCPRRTPFPFSQGRLLYGTVSLLVIDCAAGTRRHAPRFC